MPSLAKWIIADTAWHYLVLGPDQSRKKAEEALAGDVRM
jgi:hypothetical protein